MCTKYSENLSHRNDAIMVYLTAKDTRLLCGATPSALYFTPNYIHSFESHCWKILHSKNSISSSLRSRSLICCVYNNRTSKHMNCFFSLYFYAFDTFHLILNENINSLTLNLLLSFGTWSWGARIYFLYTACFNKVVGWMSAQKYISSGIPLLSIYETLP